GGGLAAANAIEELRTAGHSGDITLIGAEPHLPYERPPLSKAVLLGEEQPQSAIVHDQQWYDEQQVDVRLGSLVGGLDLERRRITVVEEEIGYDRLLLATGAAPRRLTLPGSPEVEVLHLRTIDDAASLQMRLKGRVLIVGAGWIGLEVAAAARQAGAEVTVVDTAAQPLLGVLGPEVAPIFAGLHREHGVDLRLGSSIKDVTGHHVELTDRSTLEVDMVVAGIGATPNDMLAHAAGLVVDNGVHVDAALRSPDAHVFAAGDVANHDHPRFGRLRVEHWDNAIEQGKHVAHSMLGDNAPYTRMPYFFTDQYDLGMEYVGHAAPGVDSEVVVRGDLDERVISALWLQEGTVVAGMHLNDWDAIEPLRAVVGKPADERTRDTSVALADLVG
ncbi:MAG: FAD-dependent oxidoreductase, partial [Nocardioidaceae bacterium]|nr:FAD-dependent oxidoreductase [Nocardioidaceae bacterium]